MKKSTITILFAALSLMQVNAATWVVNNTEAIAEGPASTTEGSLSYCIGNAADNDIIVFDAGMSGQSIEFLSAVKVEKSLTFDASSLLLPVSFDAKGNNQIMMLSNYANRNNNSQVNKFYNIIFKNGAAHVGDEPGAVGIYASKVYFTGCQFLNNKSDTGTGRQPGAIRCISPLAFIYFNNCIFRGNESVRQGGVISVDIAHVEIDGCLFESNLAGISGAAIDIKGGTKSGANTFPSLTIRNSTFLNNTANVVSGKSANGTVICCNQDNGYPIYLFNNTFVGNMNNNNSNAAIYTNADDIFMGGNLFGGNKYNAASGIQYSNDVRIGSNKKITSYGYNIYYGIMPNSAEEMSSTDREYRAWTAAPYVEAVANVAGVCVPNETNGLWKDLKVIPNALLCEFIGENPVDQTGAPRTGKLGFIGAYEFPSYVLEVTDDRFASTPGNGETVYKAGETVELNNVSGEFVSWYINGQHYTDNPKQLVMDNDYSVAANYEQISAIENILVADAQIYLSGTTLQVKNLTDSSVVIYSIGGQQVISQVVVSGSGSIDLINLPHGIYIVKAGNRVKKIVR
ncbi:MAG: T9SS type A sorting domain-containing protein [Candidatus Azobacteroides sp.]|nr:T9SS type A sorting domain-containing protein [Candidatus Azobacteroides sp.]